MAISDSELVELLALMKQADSVELKLTVPEGEARSAVVALGLDPLDAEIRLVSFFDTPDLILDDHGIVVRARRTQRKGDDTVVKLRPVVPSELPKKLRASSLFGVEVDAMPTGHVCSGSLKGQPTAATVRDANARNAPIRKLFSKEQRALYTERAPEGLTFDDLSIFGPIFVLKLRATPPEFKRKLVSELWIYPDGSRVLELSTKCAPTEAFQVAAESRAFLSERGVDLDAEQQTKTRKALEYFSQQAVSR